MRKNLIIIVGPTAVGKTDLAVWLAQKLKTEIISADSRQIYKEMFIGTNRPTADEMKGIKHHLLGVKSVTEYYNAYIFEKEVLELLQKLFKKYDTLIMVGGSGLYIDAVIKGIDEIPTVIPQIREAIADIFKKQGLEKLQKLTKHLDPNFYTSTDINNPMRLLKALEITIQAARPYSSFLSGKSKERPFNTILIGLDLPRQILYDKINSRVEKMVENGLIQEAKKLYPLRNYTALKTVGYQELFDYFDGKISLEQALDLIKRNTRKYARRQLSWFRRYKNLQWFNPNDKEKILNYIYHQLKICQSNG